VMLRADLYEGPDDCHPGGYLAMRGEKLIVRRVRELRAFGSWTISVSHEGRTDDVTFAVAPAEIEPWQVTPNVGVQPGPTQLGLGWK
jgi:hypothetical protein